MLRHFTFSNTITLIRPVLGLFLIIYLPTDPPFSFVNYCQMYDPVSYSIQHVWLCEYGKQNKDSWFLLTFEILNTTLEYSTLMSNRKWIYWQECTELTSCFLSCRWWICQGSRKQGRGSTGISCRRSKAMKNVEVNSIHEFLVVIIRYLARGYLGFSP
jgi:hypothetical protein